jgi:glycosyltransferase involved in cell wall biosynthesis
MKKILFVHTNFPGQFQHLARELGRRQGFDLAAIGSHTARAMPGVRLLKYTVGDGDVAATHPFARRFDLECRRAEQVLYAASNLASTGFTPDIVLAHPGWGETLPLRSMFPKSRIVTYCELFYRSIGGDADFDPEFPQTGIDGNVRIQLKNAATLLALNECDAAISPTEWQKSTYPPAYRDKISVIHEGIDVDTVKPAEAAAFTLPSGRILTKADEILTFGTRSFEPLRGYHIFMRALPRILAARKEAQVLIIGGDRSHYGLGAPDGQTWREIFLNEVAAKVDQTRIHFTGQLGYANYLNVLQISRAHVYLTYPFVLSWSLLEAMSAGCLVIVSDTAPVREVVDGKNGLLVPFFDVETLAKQAIEALSGPQRFKALRQAARDTVLARYDLKQVCLPRMLAFLGFDAENAGRIETQTRPRTETVAETVAEAAAKPARKKPKSVFVRRRERA